MRVARRKLGYFQTTSYMALGSPTSGYSERDDAFDSSSSRSGTLGHARRELFLVNLTCKDDVDRRYAGIMDIMGSISPGGHPQGLPLFFFNITLYGSHRRT
jgi:hypothetical protein